MPDLSYLTESIEDPSKTPQTKTIPGRENDMAPNKAGGVGFVLDKWSMLQRFLILGTEGATYYASQREQTQENSKNLLACIKEDGLRAVRVITEVSVAGRAPKNDPAIFALALASTHGDDATRRAAYNALSAVCRTGTHLFTFMEMRKALGKSVTGGLQRAIRAWYTDKDPEQLGYGLVKYQSRGKWSHRDVLRLAKPNGREAGEAIDAALGWAAGVELGERAANLPRKIQGFELAKVAETPQQTADLVTQYGLPREALRTEHLNDPVVWEAMLDTGMPMTALVRNLATMTRIGLLKPGGSATKQVIEQITNAEHVSKSKIHPIQLFMALRTYGAGHSLRGQNTWTPVGQIINALDDAFYMAFDNVQATGKRKMIGLDISGSMWSGVVAGIPGFTPAQAAGVMAMVSIKTGDPFEVYGFTAGGSGWGRHLAQVMPGLTPIGLSDRQRLDDVDAKMRELSRYMGGTDAALPVEWAMKSGREIDVFEIYTDNETWAGRSHPSQTLKKYRQKTGINAKLVSVGFTATDSSIADPKDPGMMDVVGFDSAAPQLIQAFVEDEI